MPSNNSKYTEEIRNETAKFILESGKSASMVAEEMGIDKNTVCRWVRDYRRAHNTPSYAEEKGYHTAIPKDQKDWKQRAMTAETKLKEKEKELARKEKERHIFMDPHD